MTPFEELQVAHERLSGLRDAVNAKQIGTYWGNIDEDPADRAEVFCAHGVVAETVSNEHADLIVMLHRTVDAQLNLLAAAIDHHIQNASTSAARWESPRALELARAINGEAS